MGQAYGAAQRPRESTGAGTRELLRDGAGLIIDAEQAVEVVTDLLADQDFAFG